MCVFINVPLYQNFHKYYRGHALCVHHGIYCLYCAQLFTTHIHFVIYNSYKLLGLKDLKHLHRENGYKSSLASVKVIPDNLEFFICHSLQSERVVLTHVSALSE